MLEQIVNYKYLGVYLDTHLTYQPHLNYIIKLMSHKIFLLTKVRSLVDRNTAIQIYKSKILPYVDYGDVLFFNSHKSTLERLQRLQNHALRICINAPPRESTDLLHELCNVPRLHERRLTHIRNISYKRSRDRRYIEIQTRNTRYHDATVLKAFIPRNKVAERSVLYNCAKEWNSLSPNIRNIDTYERFKAEQKRWLKSIIPHPPGRLEESSSERFFQNRKGRTGWRIHQNDVTHGTSPVHSRHI